MHIKNLYIKKKFLYLDEVYICTSIRDAEKTREEFKDILYKLFSKSLGE